MKYFFTMAIITGSLLHTSHSCAQASRIDSLFAAGDTTAVIDSILRDFDHYLDSLVKPKSFINISAGAGTGFFSFIDNAAFDFNTRKKIIFSPTVAYYHKSGIGLSVSGYFIREAGQFDAYQYSVSPSYDYLQNRRFSFGVAYTKYYTKEDLPFYTTPIQNELNAYFTYKKWWIQPGVSFNYGWGSRTEYEKRELDISLHQLENAKKKRRTFIYIKNNESIKDFSTLISFRHNFLWPGVFLKDDIISLVPAILISGGTLNYGFNTSFDSNSKIIQNNFLPSNTNITDVSGFDVQSATFLLRLNYSVGRFYIMPQILLDYYLHPADHRFNSVHSITAGLHF